MSQDVGKKRVTESVAMTSSAPPPASETEKRFRLQFTIDEATAAQLEKAMALASHRVRGQMTTERLFQIVLAEFIGHTTTSWPSGYLAATNRIQNECESGA